MIIKAKDIKVGTKLAESDGFLLDVVEIIKETENTITVRICSDFSSCHNLWSISKTGDKGGVVKTFFKEDELYGIA